MLSRFYSYINNSAGILSQYRGEIPLASFLNQYFGKNKKFGSKDRKEISALLYQYFRLGALEKCMAPEERILAADFVCRGSTSPVVSKLKPEWCQQEANNFFERFTRIGLKWNSERHTPWIHLISPLLSSEQYALSMLSQPDLFIRIRPGKKEKVLKALQEKGICYTESDANNLRLPNGTNLHQIIALNQDAIIQDLNSSRCGQFIKSILPEFRGWVWDACAASGGKSILMNDLYGKNIQLIVSDIRPSILQNLKRRLGEAGIDPVLHFVADLTKPLKLLNLPEVDIALVDAPCSGSGTWARTPEQHYFFDPETIYSFSLRQLTICRNVLPFVKKGGFVIYITCSVFARENEAVVNELVLQEKLILLKQEYLPGTNLNADNMFIAILKKV